VNAAFVAEEAAARPRLKLLPRTVKAGQGPSKKRTVISCQITSTVLPWHKFCHFYHGKIGKILLLIFEIEIF
jgi:hypothetical protein